MAENLEELDQLMAERSLITKEEFLERFVDLVTQGLHIQSEELKRHVELHKDGRTTPTFLPGLEELRDKGLITENELKAQVQLQLYEAEATLRIFDEITEARERGELPIPKYLPYPSFTDQLRNSGKRFMASFKRNKSNPNPNPPPPRAP